LTVSGLSLWRFAPYCWSLDNHEGFPEFCAKSPKWFRRREICFVACSSDETIAILVSDFKGLPRSFSGPDCAGSLASPLAACDGGCRRATFF
jgi:hypothetical protein